MMNKPVKLLAILSLIGLLSAPSFAFADDVKLSLPGANNVPPTGSELPPIPFDKDGTSDPLAVPDLKTRANTAELPNPMKTTQHTPTTRNMNKIVAIVNDDVITESELNREYRRITKELKKQNTNLPNENVLRAQILNQMIDEKLELQAAKRVGIEVDDATLDKAIANIAKHNKMSVAQLRKEITATGLSYSAYRKRIKDQVTIEKLMQEEVGAHIYISKSEVDNILNSVAYSSNNVPEYHLKDILIALPDEPSSQEVHDAQTKAKQIMAQLNKDSDFGQIAIAESNSQTALKGGDLGWRRAAELPTVFATKVKTMHKGDIAGPIRTANGYHILKLEDVKGGTSKHYITQTHVRHILMTPNALHSDKEIKVSLEKLRKRINNGEDFSTLAKKYSEDTVSAKQGGDLGWVEPGMLVPPFEHAMDGLAKGKISEPVKSEFGYHIIEVLGRRKKDDSKDHERLQVRKMLYQKQYGEKAQSLVNRLRNGAYIKKMDSPDDKNSA
ncbi:MAG: molecular chaperone SurA [Legionellales bacterium]|nr:molecular chaperone SurA [Legionellales bacterium]|tara:strand:+ start:7645 stop:9144 length:1500 start_codon:yes stop_codon:yes gene_type:complete